MSEVLLSAIMALDMFAPCFPVSETDDIANMVVLGMSEIGQRKQLTAAPQGSQLITLKLGI